MKYLFKLALIIAPLFSYSQSIDSLVYYKFKTDSTNNNRIFFSEVIQTPGMSKNQLYLNAYSWFAEEFKSANDVIQVNDKAAGLIIGKGRGSLLIEAGIVYITPAVPFTIKIEMKEERYRYTIYDIYIENQGDQYNGYQTKTALAREWVIDYLWKKNGKPRNNHSKYKVELIKFIESTTSNLKEAMQKKATTNDDW